MMQTACTASDALYRKVGWRLLPLLIVSYVLAQIDRKNVAFAQLEMSADLALSSAMFGFGAGVFFIGFVCLELPSSYLLTRIGIRHTVTRIMVLWGLMSCLTAFVWDAHSFYAVRFLLGAAEAGFFPAVIIYLATWFPQRYQARVVALFMSASPLSNLIASSLSGAIMEHFDGLGGLAGWQWLFLVEGAPPVLLAVLVFFMMPDEPRTARWLTEEERRAIHDDVSASQPAHAGSFTDALASAKTYLFGACHFALIFGAYAIGFWAPAVVSASGVSDLSTVGWLVSIPYAIAIIAMLVIGRLADRTGNKVGYSVAASAAAALAFALLPFIAGNVAFTIAALSVASAGMSVALSAFWAVPSSYLRGAEAAGGVALITLMGALGGFVSPVVIGWLKDVTGTFGLGFFVTCGVLTAGALLLLLGARRRISIAHAPMQPRY